MDPVKLCLIFVLGVTQFSQDQGSGEEMVDLDLMACAPQSAIWQLRIQDPVMGPPESAGDPDTLHLSYILRFI